MLKDAISQNNFLTTDFLEPIAAYYFWKLGFGALTIFDCYWYASK